MPVKKDQPNDNQPNRRNRRQADEPAPSALEASVNMDELRELIALLRDNGLAELELERDRFRVRLRREMTLSAAPARIEAVSPELLLPVARPATSAEQPVNPAIPAHPGAQAETAAQEDQDLHIIPSPIVGTFYRSPSPTAEAFVKIGSKVEPETVVCIIEAMKLMNEIQAEAEGEVVKIYVENGQPVEYGQPLFGIRG
ncbi:MAG TPA: acetyl-CoA carboxylase biotin carboxyl carrier protein [Pyrinomonadaceae bacterium]|nr:acetyl-CoA carboxylase biotin carboxyl carrier protein [Pyrinomonadaceae bacterium]